MLLVAAVVVFSQLTAPPEEIAAPNTSTTSSTTTTEVFEAPTTTIDLEGFSIAHIARGTPFRWTRAARIGAFWPVDLVEHEGEVYLFGSTDRGYAWAAEGGLEAWTSPNGISWDYLGEVIDPSFRIHRVASTDSGLVALGSRIADEAPHVLLSLNGVDWMASELPTNAKFDENHVSSLLEIIEVNGRMMVFGRAYRDPLSTLVDHLPDAVIGKGILPHGWTTSNTAEGVEVHLYAPLGLIGFSADLADLGIDDPSELLGHSQTERTFVWSSTDRRSWQLDTIEGVYIYDVWSVDPSELIALSWSSHGQAVLTSSNGIAWRESDHEALSAGTVMTVWNGSLVGQTGTPGLYRSIDGVEWETMGIDDFLPIQLNWQLYPIEAGEAGLAVVASRDRGSEASEQLPVVISKDEYVLAVDLSRGNITINRPDGRSFEIALWQDRPSPHTSVDFVTEMVTFNDPDTGEPLLSVDFATLERAEVASYSYRSDVDRALLLTRDGEEWNIQDLDRVVRDSSLIERMVVLEDRVIMITYQAPMFGRSQEPPELAIVVGEIR